MKKIIYITFTLMLCFIVISVFSATNQNTVYYKYNAKSMVVAKKTGMTVLKGDARFIKLDAQLKEMGDYVNADTITLYTKRNDSTGKDELTKMEATGNVKMKQGDMAVTCINAVLVYEPEEVINMEGTKESPAIADDGKNRIEAPRIKYFRKDDRLEADGDVTGQIIIEEKKSEESKDTNKEKTEK
jgi:lipopolysaccharide export system protein LptA